MPHDITGDFNTVETSLERVVQMEDEIEEYFQTNSEAAIALDETMEKIFAQERPLNKYTTEEGSFEYNQRDKMLSSDIYLERKKRRSDIRTRLRGSRDIAKDITKERNTQPALETVSLKDQRDDSNIVAIDVENIDDSTASKGLDYGALEVYSEDWDVIVRSDGTTDCILTEERKLDWKISCQAYSCCQQTSSGTKECKDDNESIVDIVQAMSMERGEDTSLSIDDNKDTLELSASHVDDIANKKDRMLSKADINSRDGSVDTGSLSPTLVKKAVNSMSSSTPSQNGEQSIVSTIRSLFTY